MHDAEPLDAVVIGAGFAGLYMVHRLREARVLRARLRGGQRRRRDLVLEPLPGGALRLGEHVLLVLLPARARAGVAAQRALPGPAGDPRVPGTRRRPARPAQGLHLRRARSTAVDYDEAADRWTVRTDGTGRARRPRRFVVTAVGCLSVRQPARASRAPTAFAGLTPAHRELAARAGRLHRQAGRRHRHRRLRHPGDPGDRRAGRAPDRVPAHRAVHHPGAPTARSTRTSSRCGRRTTRSGGAGRRHSMAGFPYPASIAVGARASRRSERRASTRPRGSAGGFTFLAGTFNDLCSTRRPTRPAADFVRARSTRSSRDPEVAEMLKPEEFPFGTKRLPLDTELLRHVQPAQRDAGRPQADAHRGDHPGRHPDQRRPPRARRHRLRHRVRRADRAARGARHPRPRTGARWRTRGGRARAPTWAWPCPASPTCSPSPARAARRC